MPDCGEKQKLMAVEVHRSGRYTIVMIDGKPHVGREAAKRLGLSWHAFGKRLRCGVPLDKPMQRHATHGA